MRLRNAIALIAIMGLASEAFGAEVLRRTEEITPAAVVETKSVEVKAVEASPVEVKTADAKATEVKSVEVKAVETKTTQPAPVSAETEAAAKADGLRKARLTEEVHTESKIVEKLESQRLTEEQKRAERLFSDKKESTEAPVAAPVAPVPNVTIQKVEIVQPALIQGEAPVAPAPAPLKPAKSEPAPGAVAVEDAPAPAPYRYYVGAIGEMPNFSDSRVTANFGVGATFGVMIGEDYAVEGSFIYSNFFISQGGNSFNSFNSFGNYGRQDLDQYEVKATFKWYAFRSLLGETRFKPFVGSSVAYIDREYSYSNQNAQSFYNSMYGTSGSSQSTDSFNLGLIVGADFAITPKFSIGGFFEYSTPVISKTNLNQYNNPNSYGYGYTGVKPVRVDSWDMMTLGLSAKFSF